MTPKRMFEWREIHGTWHFFMGQDSTCRRVRSNGDFVAAETKPPKNGKICQLCIKEGTKLQARLNEVL